MNRFIYLVFGEDIVIAFDESEKKMYDMASSGVCDFGLFEWDEELHRCTDLLEAYDGYGGYAEITKEQYEKLEKIKNDK